METQQSLKDNENKGAFYWRCPNWKNSDMCKGQFSWVEDWRNKAFADKAKTNTKSGGASSFAHKPNYQQQAATNGANIHQFIASQTATNAEILAEIRKTQAQLQALLHFIAPNPTTGEHAMTDVQLNGS